MQFFKNIQIGTDKLGNPEYDSEEIQHEMSSGYVTDFDQTVIPNDQRKFHEEQKIIVTRMPLNICKQADFVVFQGAKYNLKHDYGNVKDTGRWRVLTAKKYGG